MPPHVYASKYVSVFTSGRSNSCSPCGPRSAWKPKGLKAGDAKQIYPLASCRLEANCQNKDADRIFKRKKKNNSWRSAASPLCVSSPVSVELLWESRASRRLSKSILYLQRGFNIKQAEAGWLNAGDAIIRLNLEYTSLRPVWWEHFLQNNESPSSSDRDRHTEGDRGREREWGERVRDKQKREIIIAMCAFASILLGNWHDEAQISLIANITHNNDSESMWLGFQNILIHFASWQHGCTHTHTHSHCACRLLLAQRYS